MARKSVSIIYSVLILSGIFLAFFGAIVAALGLGGSTAFEGSLDSLKIKTNQTGLVILVIGAFLAGSAAIKLPKEVKILDAEEKYSYIEKLARKIPILALIIGILAVILLVLSFYT